MQTTRIVFTLLLYFPISTLVCAEPTQDRPNILWITIEDWSPDLSCYGTKGIDTPHVDQLAAEGIRYERAFTTSPVCSTSRSAMMKDLSFVSVGNGLHAGAFVVRNIGRCMANALAFVEVRSN